MNTDYDCPFPIGSIFITTEIRIPSDYRPGTFRVPFGKGRALVCVDNESQSEWLKKPEQQGGSGGLTTTDIAQGDGGTVKAVTSTSNYQPSITAYIRKRVGSGDGITYNAFNVTTGGEGYPTDRDLYGDNVIIDGETLKPKQPNPYIMD